ncbi:O-antigen ligase [Magnetospirillum sp. XM-1]|uniref:O-antigen ligase family protein n=1 Tax=Magnetospirillum sp. XM-1 TaxID=1663591 RepID=UPI00083987F6|nr:O-antigen ligase family protein [Magnetospirillum sp. XM-1]
MGLSPLFALTALFVLVHGWRDKVWMAFPRSLSVILALICGWAALTSFWAVDPARSMFSAAQLGLNTFAGVVLVGAARRLDNQGIRRVGAAMLAGIVLGMVLFVVGLVSGRRIAALLVSLESGDSYPYRLAIQVFNRGVTVTGLMAVPVLAMLWVQGRRRAASVAGLLGVAMMLAAKALATKVLLVIDVLALVAFRRPSRSMGIGLGAFLASLAILVPLGTSMLPTPQVSADWSFLPYSSHHRLTIWGFVTARIQERPVLGWGMDSARAIPGGEDDQIVYFEYPRGSGNRLPVTEQKLPLHPHNAVLQWWLELGGVGALLFAVLLARLGPLAVGAGRSTALAVCAGALVVGVTVISSVSFGFWQSWWQCTMWLLAAWATALAPLLSPSQTRDE